MTRVGITGHQQLTNAEAWSWVAHNLREQLARLPRPLVGLTSLAIGADQIFARTVLDCGGAVRAVLPFAGVERTFSPADLGPFRELLARAEVEVLDSGGSDEQCFFEAFERILSYSDVVIAVWEPARARYTGGTAHAVSHALEQQVPVIHLDPAARVVQELRPGSVRA